MTATDIADTPAGITGDRPTVLPTVTTPRPPMDAHARRQAVGPARGTAQKLLLNLTALRSQLDTLRVRLSDTPAVEFCLDDAELMSRIVCHIRNRLEALSLVREEAA
jgi:hypothetical protein